jgi:hypothetical protein
VDLKVIYLLALSATLSPGTAQVARRRVADTATVSMEDRLNAARYVAPYLWCSYYTKDADGRPVLSLRGLPTPEEWRQVEPILRLYAAGHRLTSLGLMDTPLAEMPVKGHG